MEKRIYIRIFSILFLSLLTKSCENFYRATITNDSHKNISINIKQIT